MNEVSFSGTWAATLASVRAHSELVWPVAGAFLFLPQLVLQMAIGNRAPREIFTGPDAPVIGLVIVGVALLSIIAQLTISALVIRGGTGDETLGRNLKSSLALLLPAVAANLMQGIAIFSGLLLLILPGIYLWARLLLVAPLLVSETSDPIAVLKRSWKLTEGQGFRLVGILLVLVFGFLLVSVALSGLGTALGVVTTVVAGQPEEGWGIGRWLLEVVSAAISAGISVLSIVFFAKIYLTLARPRSVLP